MPSASRELHPGRRGALPRMRRASGDPSTSDGGEPSHVVPGVEARRRPRGGGGAAHQAAGRSTHRPRRGKSLTATPRRSSMLGRRGAIRCIPFGGGRPQPYYIGVSRRCASLTRRHRRRGPSRATVALCCGSSTLCVGGASRASFPNPEGDGSQAMGLSHRAAPGATVCCAQPRRRSLILGHDAGGRPRAMAAPPPSGEVLLGAMDL
jgi:hypothetical protein